VRGQVGLLCDLDLLEITQSERDTTVTSPTLVPQKSTRMGRGFEVAARRCQLYSTFMVGFAAHQRRRGGGHGAVAIKGKPTSGASIPRGALGFTRRSLLPVSDKHYTPTRSSPHVLSFGTPAGLASKAGLIGCLQSSGFRIHCFVGVLDPGPPGTMLPDPD